MRKPNSLFKQHAVVAAHCFNRCNNKIDCVIHPRCVIWDQTAFNSIQLIMRCIANSSLMDGQIFDLIYIFVVVQHDTFGSRKVENTRSKKPHCRGKNSAQISQKDIIPTVQLFVPFWRGGKAGLPSNIRTGFFSTTGAEGEGLCLLIFKSGGKLRELANFTDSGFTGETSH